MAEPMSERRWLIAFIALVALEVAVAVILTWIGTAAPEGVGNAIFIPSLVAAIWSVAVIVIWIIRMWRAGIESPLKEFNRENARLGLRYLVARMLPPAAISVFGVWFGVLKQLVPGLGGFRLDGALAEIDYALFFGHDPWRLAHAAFGPFAGFIDFTYETWLPVLLVFPYVLTMFAPMQVRARFFLSWVLSWIVLGVVLAIALASAGPMFLDNMRLPGAAHYQGLVATLKDAPLTLRSHDYLWALYQKGDTGLGGGISAAPSMHVAIAWLYVLTTWRWWKPLAIPAFGYFAIIVLGSVFLGYHYAVDGLISIAGVSMIWVLVGRWVEGHRLTLARWGLAPLPKPAGE